MIKIGENNTCLNLYTSLKKIGCIIPLCLVLFSISYNCNAQNSENTNCINNLKLANTFYNEGKINHSIQLITPCLKAYETKEYFEAQRLLALCFLSTNEQENAKLAVVQMLKTQPNYREFPYFDPLELTKMLSKYEVWPRVEIGLTAGSNLNSVRILKSYSLTQSNAVFAPRVGYQTGFFAEYYLNKRTSIRPTILLEGVGYVRTADDVSSWTQSYTENLNYLSVPLVLSRNIIQNKKWDIALNLGPQIRFLLSSSSKIVLSNNASNQNIRNSSNTFNARYSTLLSAFTGLSAKHDLAGGIVSFNINYSYGLNNVVNEENRWLDIATIIKNQYVDSDIAFNTSSISVAYQFPLKGTYVVREKKN